MRRLRPLILALCLLPAGPVLAEPTASLAIPAAGPDVLALIRADRWPEAEAAARQWIDPVAAKLVTYYRLQSPGAASPGEIDAFMAENPDWPGQATLARRREDALAAEADDAAVLPFCERLALHGAPALLRCAEARLHVGQAGPAAAEARLAWTGPGIADPAAEARFMQRWGKEISPEDQWRRFDRLAWTDPGAAARQLLRLDAAHRQEGAARLALRRNDPKAPALLAALPAALRADPILMLEEARRLRLAKDDAGALALWSSAGAAAEREAPSDHLQAYWTEREMLARRLLADGDAKGAYALVAAHGQAAPEAVGAAEFLAGWIALRRLNDPPAATKHFQALAGTSKAAITQARAHYWLGRAAAAAGDGAAARAEYATSATWPTTYYGQLAALALGDDPAALNARIRAVRDPDWNGGQAVAFAGREVARAAALLVAWGEAYRARPFLVRLEELAPDSADRAMVAQLALGFGLPDQAVTIARRAGREGLVLAGTGWPETVRPPEGAVETALTLGVIRQESSFDAQAQSPAGARGLMQLMPATAAEVARRIGDGGTGAPSLGDPAENMRLGTTFLAGLLARFDGSLPLAVAAYNAGPNRVAEWLAANGDPRTGPTGTGSVDMIDWIELIPFNETRNYVQRVIENVAVYRARQGVALPHPLAPRKS